MSSGEKLKKIPGECPTPDELGHSGWNILHSAAAVYPYKPSPIQQEAFRSFLYSWSHVYACGHCAYHMRSYLKKNTPDVTDKLALNRYICEFHNAVNLHVGNPVYDCDPMTVLRRWHPTFPEMEDQPTIEEQLAEQKRLEGAEAQRKQVEELQQQQARAFSFRDENSRSRSMGRWRTDMTNSNNNTNVNADVFAAGWAVSSRLEKQEEVTEKEATRETSASSVPPAETKQKRWWFFGDNSPSKTPMTSSTVKNEKTIIGSSSSSGSGSGDGGGTNSNNSGKVADDETDVMAVLKRLKACMVYCPENDKKAAKT